MRNVRGAAPASRDGGYTRVYRRLWDHPVFRSKVEAAIFAWMCSAAQWRETRLPTRWGPVTLGVGELLIAERELSADWGVHRNGIRGLLQRLVQEGTIELFRDRCPHRCGTVCRIVNYAAYQGLGDASEELQDRNRTEGRAEAGPQEDRKRTKNKEGNTGKEGKEGGRGRAGQAPLPLGPVLVVADGQPARRAERGSRLPPDWWPDEAQRTFAADLGLEVDWVANQFRDHFLSRPGQAGVMLNWDACWRNWCRRQVEFDRQRRGGGGRAGKPANRLDWLETSIFDAPGGDDAGGGGPILDMAAGG